ncbi:ABC transporter ATP-binding protein [Oleiharenicola lentus]|uniref:ABC transporter ATP-binding protein n=1 Tax=Oleiharenicola lentus TaxID=2508720 RepID=UPI003F66BAF9
MPDSELLLDFENVTVARGEKNVLRGFTLQMRRGEHVALLGPNGSGKSTLVKLITGELYPHTGVRKWRFELFGRETWSLDDVRERIGIVTLDMLSHLSHEITTRVVTGREMVLSGFFNSLGLWPHHRPTTAHERRAKELLRYLEVTHLANRSMAEMSSGEQRRIMIGRALVHDPEAMILDEATASLDPGAVNEFLLVLRKLAQSGKSLIVVTHQIADLIPEIERVILIKSGRIVADGPKQKHLTSASLSDLFGAKLRVVRHGQNYDIVAG